MRIEILHFVLEGNCVGYFANDILMQIKEQRDIFYIEFGYYPDYISIPNDILIFLEKHDDVSTPEFGKGIHTIYGMKVITRDKHNVEALSEREAICVKENR